MKFLLSAGVPWDAVAANVLEGKEPLQLIRDIKDRSLARELLDLYKNEDFRREFDFEVKQNTLPVEWKSLNSTTDQQQTTLEEIVPMEDDMTPTLGIFRDKPELRGAQALLKQDGIKQVIFGHTHTEIDGRQPDLRVPNYFNTGSWTNSIDLKRRENRIRLKNLSEVDLRDDSLFELRLMYAVVEVGERNQTEVQLFQL